MGKIIYFKYGEYYSRYCLKLYLFKNYINPPFFTYKLFILIKRFNKSKDN